MEGMFFTDIFHAKIVDNKGELDWSPFVLPKAWYQLALVVTTFVETLLKQLIGQQAGLWEAIHASIRFDVDHAVVRHNRFQIIFQDNFVGDISNVDTYVLGACNWSHAILNTP